MLVDILKFALHIYLWITYIHIISYFYILKIAFSIYKINNHFSYVCILKQYLIKCRFLILYQRKCSLYRYIYRSAQKISGLFELCGLKLIPKESTWCR